MSGYLQTASVSNTHISIDATPETGINFLSTITVFIVRRNGEMSHRSVLAFICGGKKLHMKMDKGMVFFASPTPK